MMDNLYKNEINIKGVHAPYQVRHHEKDGLHHYTVHHQGNKVGEASLSRDKSYVTDVMVREDHRGRGLASELYKHIEKHQNIKLQPSKFQSDKGKNLWKRIKGQLKEARSNAKYEKGMIGFHGTAREFDDFDDNAERHPQTPEREVKGHFFTNDQHAAYGYAIRSRKINPEGKTRVKKVALHMENPKDVTHHIKRLMKQGKSFGDAKHEAYNSVDRNKHDGVYHRGTAYNPPEYVAFSSKHVKPLKD